MIKFKKIILMVLVSFVMSMVYLVEVDAATEEYVVILDPTANATYGQGLDITWSEDGQLYKSIKITDALGNSTNVLPTNFYVRLKSAGGDSSGDILSYCIEPMVLTSHGEPYNPYDGDLDAIVLAEKRLQLQMISYFGYGYNGDNSQLAYIATQVAIWQELGNTVSEIDSSVLTHAETIKNRVAAYKSEAKPSFIGQEIVLGGYGEANGVKIIDTNNKISSWYDGKSTGNFSVVKSGEEVTIFATENVSAETGTIQFQNIQPSVEVTRGIDIIYTNPSAKQTLMKISGVDFAKFGLSVRMAKGNVYINKQDIATGSELVGAHMEVVNKNTGAVIDSWVSNGTQHSILNLVAGQYTLKETASPNGYTIAQEIDFTISVDGQVVPIIMKDDYTKIAINKFESLNGELTTNRVVGAKLQVIDKLSGAIVYEFITGSTSESLIKKLVINRNYILREVETPSGYEKASDIEFVVANTPNVQTVTMYDAKMNVEMISRASIATKTSSNANVTKGSVNTGDQSMMQELILLLAGSAMCIVYIKVKKQTE